MQDVTGGLEVEMGIEPKPNRIRILSFQRTEQNWNSDAGKTKRNRTEAEPTGDMCVAWTGKHDLRN